MKTPVFAAVLGALALTIAPSAVASSSTTAPAKKADKTKAVRSNWPAENVSGSIDMVDPSQKLLIVKGDQTIFDFVVTPKTRILNGKQQLTLADLSSTNHSQVHVHFIPERKGDVAATIQLNQ
jgi:hypothetical protein